jgi:hypothetical protein
MKKININIPLFQDLIKGKKVSQGFDFRYQTTSVPNHINILRKEGIEIATVANRKAYKLVDDIENIAVAKRVYDELIEKEVNESLILILNDLLKGEIITPIYSNKFGINKLREIIYRLRKKGVIFVKERVETEKSFFYQFSIVDNSSKAIISEMLKF